MSLLKRRERSRGTRLFFATDIHGSEQCFRKFLNAADFYDVDCLILGGDITGKLLVPITRHADGHYSASYADNDYPNLDEQRKDELAAAVRRGGHYPFVGSRDEIAQLADDQRREQLFRKMVHDSIAGWVALAEERLRGKGKRLLVAPGNDDFFDIDPPLKASDVVEFAEDRCIRLDGHEVITTGYSNPTPWDTEREISEDELRAKLERMYAQASGPENLIVVLHPPPLQSGIDEAPELSDDLRMSMDMGGVRKMPVGSRAVRDFIEEHQPLLGLHGHVHEGRGITTIGRTVCINPGSEYTEGTLAGAIVELGDGTVISRQLATG